MKNIPHDIDRTLWAIAESNDPRAIEEFAERYPAFKAELIARIDLVRSLKSQRPDRQAPYLTLPHARTQPSFSRGYGLLLAGALLASVALAAVVSVRSFQPKPPPVVQNTVVHVPIDKPAPSQGTIPDKLVRPEDERPVVTTEDGQTGQSDDPFQTAVTIDHEHASLKSVIREIGLKAKLTLDIAPGFEDQEVQVRYAGVPAIEALSDLSQNFGFTVMPQEAGRALIIPAIDPSRPPVTVPGGSFSEPTGKPTNHRDAVAPSGPGKGQ